MKKNLLIMFVMIFSIAAAQARLLPEDLKLDNIFLGDYGLLYPWENELVSRVTVENLAKKDLDDLRVSITIDELGLETSSNTFDLDGIDDRFDHKRTVWLFLGLPNNIKPGEYFVRVVVENDDVRRVKYRYLLVI